MQTPYPATRLKAPTADAPRTIEALRPAHHLRRSVAALGALILSSMISPAQTWLPTPPGAADSIWNNPLNWAPANVPDVPGETAIFALSNKLNPTVIAPISINGITFTAVAPSYTIVNNAGISLVGAGLLNGSAVTQTFTNNSAIDFVNAASAGSNVVLVNGAALSSVDFFNTSTASSATIVNGAASTSVNFFDTATAAGSAIVNSSPTGQVNFLGTTTAATSVIVNSGSGAIQGATVSFFATSTAASAVITNSGQNSRAFFGANSTAAAATINNSGLSSGAAFSQTASAGTAIITNSGNSSRTDFNDQSSAADSTILLSGPLSSATFLNDSTAGDATITLTVPTALLTFFDASSAGTAAIENSGSGPFPASLVGFFGTSTADRSAITNSGSNTQTLFSDRSTAGNATITNRGAGSSTAFAAAASGGRARLINAQATAFIDLSLLTTAGTTVGSVEGNGFINLGSKRLTTGLNDLSTTFAGIIRDGGLNGGLGGSLVKVGGGTLTLSGANTFSGGTRLQGGTLAVASDQALGIGDVRLTNGVLRATGSPRHINVRRDYTQTGGELALRIGGAGEGQQDRLAVLGRANLGGRLRVDPLNGFRPARGDSFTVVTADGGVNGQFGDFQNNLQGDFALRLELIYEPNQVILGFVQGNFTPFAKTPNQRAVAGALDRSLFDSGAFDLIDELNALPTGSLPDALDKIAPEELGAIFEITRSSAKIQAFTINHRLDEIHAAAWARRSEARPDAGGKEMVDGKTAREYKGAKEIKEVIPAAPPFDRVGLFVNANGEFVNVGDTFNARGFDLESGGATLGVDYLFGENFAAGLLFNYTRTRVDLTGSGRIEADAVRGGIYTSLFGHGLYLNTYIAGGLNTYDTRREGFEGRARGSTDGAEFNALVTAGYDAHLGRFTIGPVASYHYTYSTYSSFEENSSLAPLRLDSQGGESSRTNLGARATYDLQLGGIVFTPELRASWQHEFGDVTHSTRARFDFGGPDFTVQSAEVGRDSLLVGAGFSVTFNERCAAYAFYDGELGRSNYDAHNGILGLRVSF